MGERFALVIVAVGLVTIIPSAQGQQVTAESLNEVVAINRLIAAAAENYPNVDRALVWSMVWQESGYRVDAIGKNKTPTKDRGDDVGLGQLNWWRKNKCGLTIEQALDPRKNVDCMVYAVSYLSDIYKKHVNPRPLVVAAYNAGEGAVNKCYSSWPRGGPNCSTKIRGVPYNRKVDKG